MNHDLRAAAGCVGLILALGGEIDSGNRCHGHQPDRNSTAVRDFAGLRTIILIKEIKQRNQWMKQPEEQIQHGKGTGLKG